MGNKRLVRRVIYLAVAGAVAAGALIIGTAVANAKSDPPPVDQKTVIVHQSGQLEGSSDSVDAQSEMSWG